MTLLDAPAFDLRRANRIRNAFITLLVLVGVAIVVMLAGFITGHGWAYSNLGAERHVDQFLTAIEHKDFAKAYGVYVNDPAWQQNPDKYKAYPLDRFTEDWTTYSPVGPIVSHHVDKSVTDGSGAFGTTILVGSTVNGSKRLFLPYQRSDGTLSYPAPHIFEY